MPSIFFTPIPPLGFGLPSFTGAVGAEEIATLKSTLAAKAGPIFFFVPSSVLLIILDACAAALGCLNPLRGVVFVRAIFFL